MTDWLLSPLAAFAFYALLNALVSGAGAAFAARGKESVGKTSSYAGGELPDKAPAAPGYRQFFLVALFFAVLHLGALMLGSSDLSPVAGVYLLGLALALLALILG